MICLFYSLLNDYGTILVIFYEEGFDIFLFSYKLLKLFTFMLLNCGVCGFI